MLKASCLPLVLTLPELRHISNQILSVLVYSCDKFLFTLSSVSKITQSLVANSLRGTTPTPSVTHRRRSRCNIAGYILTPAKAISTQENLPHFLILFPSFLSPSVLGAPLLAFQSRGENTGGSTGISPERTVFLEVFSEVWHSAGAIPQAPNFPAEPC